MIFRAVLHVCPGKRESPLASASSWFIIVPFIALDLPAPPTVHAPGSAIDAELAEETRRKDLAMTRGAEAAAPQPGRWK
jgi:hypothetical protein